MTEAYHRPLLHIDFGKFRPKFQSNFVLTLAWSPSAFGWYGLLITVGGDFSQTVTGAIGMCSKHRPGHYHRAASG